MKSLPGGRRALIARVSGCPKTGNSIDDFRGSEMNGYDQYLTAVYRASISDCSAGPAAETLTVGDIFRLSANILLQDNWEF